VWTYPGVESYYKNSKGRVVINNPFRILDVWRMTQVSDLDDFHCSSHVETLVKAAVR
jgi:4-hydroxyacetophenone monooxygenase